MLTRPTTSSNIHTYTYSPPIFIIIIIIIIIIIKIIIIIIIIIIINSFIYTGRVKAIRPSLPLNQ